VKRARDDNSRCREDPWRQSVSRALPAPRSSELSQAQHDSPLSRWPLAMGVCKGKWDAAEST
jgi:hypothetical protein